MTTRFTPELVQAGLTFARAAYRALKGKPDRKSAVDALTSAVKAMHAVNPHANLRGMALDIAVIVNADPDMSEEDFMRMMADEPRVKEVFV